MTIKKMTGGYDAVSWTSKPFDYYIQTIDHRFGHFSPLGPLTLCSQLEQYFERERTKSMKQASTVGMYCQPLSIRLKLLCRTKPVKAAHTAVSDNDHQEEDRLPLKLVHRQHLAAVGRQPGTNKSKAAQQ
jgi:hypothetical protein